MRRHRLPLACCLTLLLSCGFALAEESWIHVRVDEGDSDDGSVRVSIPFSLVEAVLPAIEVDQFRHGRLRLDGFDLDQVDVRAILAQLASTDDTEFVKVRDGRQTVTVAKRDRFLLVNVDDTDRGDMVRVRVPLAVVDALIGPRGNLEELDIAAALGELRGFDGDLVEVRDGHDTVRVWIDGQNAIAD